MARHVNPTKHIGLWPATALVVGPMLGVGIFIGPPQVAASVGSESAFLLLWIAGGVTAMCGALSVAELGAMLPLSGGHYVYLRRAYGNGVGFAVGWLQVLAVFPGSIGTVALALGTYQLPVLFGLDLNLPANKAPFDVVTDFAMFGAVAFETLAVASIFVFRHRLPAADRPYRCWGYPVVPILYCLIMGAVLANMFMTPEQRSEARIGLGFIAVGASVYLLMFRRGRES